MSWDWSVIKIGDVEWGMSESIYKYERSITTIVEGENVKYIEALRIDTYQWTKELIEQKILEKLPIENN